MACSYLQNMFAVYTDQFTSPTQLQMSKKDLIHQQLIDISFQKPLK